MMWQCCLVAIFILVSTSRSYPAVFFENQKCTARNGRFGVCTRLSRCPDVFETVQTHLRHKHVRCGFVDFEEVVCCPRDEYEPPSDDEESKSTTACKEYRRTENTYGRYNILGGLRTLDGEFPHMAALAYLQKGETTVSWRCAGSLISDRFVLTAAHCIPDGQGGPVFVRLGVRELTADTNADFDYGIETVIRHPGYKSKFYYDDVGLVKLSSKVPFSVEVSPACLGTELVTGDIVITATGWGATDPGATVVSQELLQVNITTMEQSTCTGMMRSDSKLPRGVADTMLCARDPAGRGDTCLGDSGGPVQLKRADSVTATVVGVTSFGNTPCGGRTPSVYTRVSSYVDWIEGIVWP